MNADHGFRVNVGRPETCARRSGAHGAPGGDAAAEGCVNVPMCLAWPLCRITRSGNGGMRADGTASMNTARATATQGQRRHDSCGTAGPSGVIGGMARTGRPAPGNSGNRWTQSVILRRTEQTAQRSGKPLRARNRRRDDRKIRQQRHHMRAGAMTTAGAAVPARSRIRIHRGSGRISTWRVITINAHTRIEAGAGRCRQRPVERIGRTERRHTRLHHHQPHAQQRNDAKIAAQAKHQGSGRRGHGAQSTVADRR